MPYAQHPEAWGWRFSDGRLGLWAHPDFERLTANGQPTPDAEPVRVRLVPVRDYAAMRRAGREGRSS